MRSLCRPYGALSLFDRYPSLPAWAKLCRAYGAGSGRLQQVWSEMKWDLTTCLAEVDNFRAAVERCCWKIREACSQGQSSLNADGLYRS